jgi:hydroxysqualene synthase
MGESSDLSSGKGHRDENFPVASFLIAPRHRGIVLSFYRFARAADDVADHPTAPPEEKLRLLDAMRRTVLGEADESREAAAIRQAMRERSLSPQHCVDLIEAFSRDVTKLRYENWDDLMDYCRYSAMPVGRFVLDVHGEARSAWPASDALCAALQIINHLQDCGKDYRDLNRVYIPMDAFAAAGTDAQSLSAPRASPELLSVIRGLAERTSALLDRARPFAGQIRDSRLGLEVSVIQRLAEDLTARLKRRDPLSMRVHHTKAEALYCAARAGARFFAGKLGGKRVDAIAGERR